MIKLSDEKIDRIIKSIEHEMRNYQYWKLHKHKLNEKLQLLDSKMYKVKGVSYDAVRSVSNINHDSILIEYIDQKEEIEKKIEWINEKLHFVDMFVSQLELGDRKFIRTALLERRSFDTNDAVAVRMGLSESGIRYKIDTIIRNKVMVFLTESKGGEIESETNGGIRDPVKGVDDTS